MKLVGKCSILRMKPKKEIEYPLIRLPKEYKDLIGKEALIYKIDRNKFLISVNNELEDELYNWLYNFLNSLKTNKNSAQRFNEIEINSDRSLDKYQEELMNNLKMDRWGFEPQAFAMPRRRSTKLSYRPLKSQISSCL